MNQSRLLEEGYCLLVWNNKPIFISRDQQKYRDVYVYNPKHQIFVLHGAIDISQGVEGGLEKLFEGEKE